MQTHKKLTKQERDWLAIWKAEGLSNKECARRLGRHTATIGRELKRNSFQGKYYVAIYAQARAEEKWQRVAYGKQPLKNAHVYRYVTEYLRNGWSPDQIAGRLKREHAKDPYWWITAETIYRWIYQEEQLKADQPWYEYLRRKQKKRKHYQGRKVHRSPIPDRISIHDREKHIDTRTQFGHWEGDTIEGKGHKDGVHTEVERISRRIMGKKVAAIASAITVQIQRELFAPLPTHARRSTTLDNGRENHLHMRLKELKMKTYFADPYSSWQRGTNEHGNWHIRYYFPKGTDFTLVSEDELQDVIEEINNRPRKILHYQTANEVFTKLLDTKEVGVAISS